jgi:dTDP-4-amino-4,6-dideoxygalactose transaminase
MQGTSITSISREELINLHDILYNSRRNGESYFSEPCKEILTEIYQGKSIFLFDSDFSALVIGLKSIGIDQHDEVMISSIASPILDLAIHSIGAIPVLVPVEKTNLNFSVAAIKSKLTNKTKAILVELFNGIFPEMDELIYFTAQHGLLLIEYSSNGLGASYKYNPVGSFGNIGIIGFNNFQTPIQLGCFLIVNDSSLTKLMENNLNQNSILALSELKAGILLPNLRELDNLKELRKQVWNNYYNVLQVFEEEQRFSILGSDCLDSHNYSGFTLIFDEKELGKELQGQLMDKEIESNYISSPNFTLLNLPFYAQLNEEEILQICLHVSEFFGGEENQEAFLDIRKIFLDNLDF